MRRLYKILAVVLFTAYLFVGLRIFPDYGVHVDENNNQRFGKRWGEYVLNTLHPDHAQKRPGYSLQDVSHGPFWEIGLYFIQKVFLPAKADSKEVILVRHLANFLLFYVSVIFFYFTCRRIFGSDALALAGCLMLVVNPRIFAHSFYNTVDLGFLSFFIICIYTLFYFLDKKSFFSAACHALASAILVDVRVAGLLMPALTVLLLVWDMCSVKVARERERQFKLLTVYFLVFVFFMVLCWPFLWSNTFAGFVENLKGGGLDWFKYKNAGPSYNFIWIAVTTPVFYLFLFVLGLSMGLFQRIRQGVRTVKYDGFVIALSLFFMPIFAAMLARTWLYDDWRHHYFVYCPFVIVSLYGMQYILFFVDRARSALLKAVAKMGLAVMVLAGVLFPFLYIVKHHPFQYMYVNSLSGALLVKGGYYFSNCDYWALSGRRVQEYILAHDKRDKIRLYFYPYQWLGNLGLLPPKERQRLEKVTLADGPDYLIDFYHHGKRNFFDPAAYKLYYVLSSGTVPMATVYKKEILP